MTDAPNRLIRVRATPWCGAFEAAVLVAALLALGWFLIPAHWSSIWMDREFTGGVGPLANRLVDGERLYTDGMHSPLPPLPFVLMRVVGGGDAGWLSGSVLNYLFQVLTLGLSYLTLRHVFGQRVAFVATLCTIPVFLALRKTVVYDPFVQAWVALAALIVATLPARWPVLLGIVSALALLTKQSTATGIVAGVALALLITPMAGKLFRRPWWRAVALYGATTLAVSAVVVIAVTPWASPGGFVHDVLVTGAEVKGDQTDVVGKLRIWGDDLVVVTVVFLLIAAVVVLAARRLGLGSRATSWWRTARDADADQSTGFALTGAATAGAALGALSWALDSMRAGDPWFTASEVLPRVYDYRFTGTFAAVLAVALIVVWAYRRRPHASAQRFVRVFCVLVGAAVMMSLSGPELRWTYDNNPLIAFGFACLVAGALWLAGLFGAGRPRRRLAFTAAVTGVVSAVCWASLGDQIWVASRATESWSEIEHLDGAKLRPASSGLRTLVADVRELAAPDETVLLLPEDPNVQAWFERPRPRLTSAMVFADQYWDRYVDEDFERLAADPPKVIVVGPRLSWRPFGRLFHRHWGAERLIDRVKRELLARRYERRPPVKFQIAPWRYGLKVPPEWLDVWVRR